MSKLLLMHNLNQIHLELEMAWIGIPLFPLHLKNRRMILILFLKGQIEELRDWDGVVVVSSSPSILVLRSVSVFAVLGRYRWLHFHIEERVTKVLGITRWVDWGCKTRGRVSINDQGGKKAVKTCVLVNMRPVTGTTDEVRQIGMRICLKNLHH